MKKPERLTFAKEIELLARTHGAYKAFAAFVRLAACALALQTREADYLDEAKHWTRAELEAFGRALASLIVEMEDRPFEDVLGSHYMEFALSSKAQQWGGEFHTPKPVCDLIARMLGDDLPREGPITVLEPACGSGAMILALAQAPPAEDRRRLRVTAIDISRVACDMTFINTTLWGVPCRVLHGNTISMEFWAGWSNIHYLAPWLPLLMRKDSPEAKHQGQPPGESEIKSVAVALGQQEFAL